MSVTRITHDMRRVEVPQPPRWRPVVRLVHDIVEEPQAPMVTYQSVPDTIRIEVSVSLARALRGIIGWFTTVSKYLRDTKGDSRIPSSEQVSDMASEVAVLWHALNRELDGLGASAGEGGVGSAPTPAASQYAPGPWIAKDGFRVGSR